MPFIIKDGILKNYIEEDGITDITIPNSVKEIDSNTFRDCKFLTRVTVPEGITKIDGGTFRNCTSLKEVNLPYGLKKINSQAFFNCTSLQQINIPESVTEINCRAFMNCTSLTSITLPEGITTLYSMTFSNCTSLTYVKLPDSLTSIKGAVFQNCRSLKSLTLPDSVTEILGNAFGNCISLESISLPKNLNELGSVVFENCILIENITIPDNTKKMNRFALTNCGKNTVLKIFGYEFSPEDIDFRMVSPPEIKAMLDTKDYSLGFDQHTNYNIAIKVYLKTAQPEAEAFIRENSTKIFGHFINRNNYSTISKLLESEKFVTEHNINALIEYAIQNTQNGGDMQIQLLLTNYKFEHFGIANPLDELI